MLKIGWKDRKKERTIKNKTSVLVVESDYNSQNAQFGLVIVLKCKKKQSSLCFSDLTTRILIYFYRFLLSIGVKRNFAEVLACFQIESSNYHLLSEKKPDVHGRFVLDRTHSEENQGRNL